VTDQASNKNWRNHLFTYRSYTPIPFLLVMLIFARPTGFSMAIGVVVAILGESIRFWGVSYAGSETRTTGAVGGTQLVTSGPYSHLRNPLYLGNILLYLGIGIMSNALMPYLQFIALIYFVFQYSVIIRLEEQYLGDTFDNWREYSANVGRFIPSLRGFKGGRKLEPDFPRALRSERSSLLALVSISAILAAIFFYRGAA
jgi:protein-S-isoprenylcysteine O-methyltransferase Ste14